MIKTIGRGVLDAPAFAGHDGRVALQHFIVIARAAKQSIARQVEGWIVSLRAQ